MKPIATFYRGVILAGGSGSRMAALSGGRNKHLLPIGDQPMVMHGVRKMMGAGISDITIVTSPEALGDLGTCLGAGINPHNCRLSYVVQERPLGLAHAIQRAERYSDTRNLVVLLGDNIFEESLAALVERNYDAVAALPVPDGISASHPDVMLRTAWGAQLVLKTIVGDYQAFGVANVDPLTGLVRYVVEKPSANLFGPSTPVVTGIYFYDNRVFEHCRNLVASPRGELEITDLNNLYAGLHQCRFQLLAGAYWHDAGTPDGWRAADQAVCKLTPRWSLV